MPRIFLPDNLPAQPTSGLLTVYNEFAVAAGRKPLKGWSESKAKLIDRINELHALLAPDNTAEAAAQLPAEGVITGRIETDGSHIEEISPAEPYPAPAPRKHGPQKFRDTDVITVLQLPTKPKKNSGRNPYQHYANGLTVRQVLDLGLTRRDVNWDVKQGYIAVNPPKTP